VPKPTLTNWVRRDRERRGERANPATVDMDRARQLEKENAELRMERDVLKGSGVLWAKRRCAERGVVHRLSEGRPRGAHAVACRALGASDSWSYKWHDPRRTASSAGG